MKKIEKPKLNKDGEDLRPLNDELGSFGLEPPKNYRKDRTVQKEELISTPNKSDKSKKNNLSKKSKKSDNLTKEEKNAIHKKKRKLKKKFRVAFGIIGLILALCIVIVILSLTVFFKIDTINVEGSTKYDYDQVTAVLPISKDQNLFLIDTNSATEKLEQNLPYIYSVKIKRELPSTITVEITEPETIYYVENTDNTYTYLDDTFKVIELNAVEIPLENGVEIKKAALVSPVAGSTVTLTNEALTDDIKQLMTVIKDLKLTEATAIYSESKVSNYIVYEDRITIKIGETSKAEDKVYSALAAIEKLNESDPEAIGTMTSTGGKEVYFTDQE